MSLSLLTLLTNVFSQLAHFAVSSRAFKVEEVRCTLLLLSYEMNRALGHLCAHIG